MARALVLVLGALILNDDRDAGRLVGDAHGRFRAVDVLSPGPAPGAHGIDTQITLVDGEIDLLRLGHHRHGRRRGVDAPARLGFRYTLDPGAHRSRISAARRHRARTLRR